MSNLRKYIDKLHKKTTETKLVAEEYAIIQDGEVTGTTDSKTAKEALDKGAIVYLMKTYQLTITKKL